MNNSKHNVRKDKKLQVWANLKRCATDATLYWAAKKLKSWGALEKVDDCFVSGTVLQNYSLPSFLILREIKFGSLYTKQNRLQKNLIAQIRKMRNYRVKSSIYYSKSKCVRGGSLFENCKQTAKNVNKFLKIEKICCFSNTIWLY